MSELTMDDLLKDLNDSKQSLRELQAEEKTLKQSINELENRIILNLENQGVDRIGNDVCTVSIKKEIVPTVDDWDSLSCYKNACLQPLTESCNKWDKRFQVLQQLS